MVVCFGDSLCDAEVIFCVMVWMLAFVCDVVRVRVVFCKLSVCCVVMFIIYGVRCCVFCVYVCVCV